MGVAPSHRYYEMVRPSPTHWYFRPRGATAWAFSLGTTGKVLTFHTGAQIGVTPPVHRTPHGQYAGSLTLWHFPYGVVKQKSLRASAACSPGSAPRPLGSRRPETAGHRGRSCVCPIHRTVRECGRNERPMGDSDPNGRFHPPTPAGPRGSPHPDLSVSICRLFRVSPSSSCARSQAPWRRGRDAAVAVPPARPR